MQIPERSRIMKIEQIIKEKGREQFYDYYSSLGYDHKTAAALALFTYGRNSYSKFSIDDLYEALCRGEEYLPPEILEEMKRRKSRQSRFYSAGANNTLYRSAPKKLSCRSVRRTGTRYSSAVFAFLKIRSIKGEQRPCRRRRL